MFRPSTMPSAEQSVTPAGHGSRADRREFCRTAAGSVLAAAGVAAGWMSPDQLHADSSTESSKPVNDNQQPIIDTHQHLWDLDIVKLPWLAGDAVKSIRRSFVMEDYLQATQGLNVARAIYMEVNVAPEHQDREAEYVLKLCEDPGNPTVAAVIGGSPSSADFPRYIRQYAKNPALKGVRTVLHDADRPRGMCLEPQFVRNIQLLGQLGLRYDLCMRPGELLDGAKLIEQCPDTRFVIDHCGNMPVNSTDRKLRAAWEAGITAAAGHKNTVCKISGIIVTADKDNWQPEDLASVINFCLDAFGEDRVIFAGDWPVCTLTAPLAGWVGALKQIVAERSAAQQRKLFHDNAVAFYELPKA